MLVLLNLEYIKIRSCTNIVYFLSMPSVSEALPLLTSLKMWGCKKLEQVFLLEEENLGGGRGIQIDKVRFPRLEKIQLYNLEALNGFCNGIHNIQLPSLHTLTISKLPNIRGFFPNDDSLSTEPNHSANTQSLFRKEDTLRSLRHLEPCYLDDAMLFHNQLLSRCCFRKLDSLSMSKCKNVAPCLFMDVVNDDAPSAKDEEEQGEKVSETSLFPHLTKLILSDLPDLRSLVSQNMQKVPFGYNLKAVYVGFCKRLLHFSSLAVARTFAQQVENMSFVVCNEMKHVFVLEENEVEGADQSQICDIQFPMLRKLKLSYLPAMASFCKGANNIDFPNLNEIYISASNNLKGFVIPTDGDQSSDMPYLFGSKVSFGGLESMVLQNLESELWYHQLSNTQYLSELQNLFIQGCHEIKYVFSSFSTGALMNLKKLQIRCCFRIESVIVGDGMHLFPKLEVLELQELPKLGSFS